ncbi:MAG: LysM peptidoglycan-binding domain-containing protein [Chitinophagaceae bacterium]|nr:LysM peptidoglycan-binding domain-containing protein [Chitinophagaceae bacterium]
MKKLVIILSLFLSLGSVAQPSADIIEYINNYKQLAILEMQRTGVPASIKLAQGIHETSAGKSDLVLKSRNHFGIKCKATWTGKKVYHDDDARGECFRSYSSSTDSYMDHSNFLKGSERYSSLFELDPTDYKAWAFGLKRAGYATNNKYSQIIIKLIEGYDLQQYSLIAMGKLAPSDEIMAGTGQDVIDVSVPAATIEAVAVSEQPKEELKEIATNYPKGEFSINNTRVIFAKSGTSLLGIAEQNDIPLGRLLDFNDIKAKDILEKSQLVFLQRKRKVSFNEFHIVQSGETLYDIAQQEGIRLESLVEYNLLRPHMKPAPGQKLNLQTKSSVRPALAEEIIAANTVQEAVLRKSSQADPAGTRHIVQTKETIYSISKKYGVDVEKILEWNNLQGFELRVGQELVIHKN